MTPTQVDQVIDRFKHLFPAVDFSLENDITYGEYTCHARHWSGLICSHRVRYEDLNTPSLVHGFEECIFKLQKDLMIKPRPDKVHRYTYDYQYPLRYNGSDKEIVKDNTIKENEVENLGVF